MEEAVLAIATTVQAMGCQAAALPKDKLDALLADPKALTDLLRGHIIEGYYPYGSLSSAPGVPGFNRTVTNLRGEKLTLHMIRGATSFKTSQYSPSWRIASLNCTKSTGLRM